MGIPSVSRTFLTVPIYEFKNKNAENLHSVWLYKLEDTSISMQFVKEIVSTVLNWYTLFFS